MSEQLLPRTFRNLAIDFRALGCAPALPVLRLWALQHNALLERAGELVMQASDAGLLSALPGLAELVAKHRTPTPKEGQCRRIHGPHNLFIDVSGGSTVDVLRTEKGLVTTGLGFGGLLPAAGLLPHNGLDECERHALACERLAELVAATGSGSIITIIARDLCRLARCMAGFARLSVTTSEVSRFDPATDYAETRQRIRDLAAEYERYADAENDIIRARGIGKLFMLDDKPYACAHGAAYRLTLAATVGGPERLAAQEADLCRTLDRVLAEIDAEAACASTPSSASGSMSPSISPADAPSTPNQHRYTPAELGVIMGLGESARREWTKKAGVALPARGQKDFPYSRAQVEAVLRYYIANGPTLHVRSKCQTALKALNNPETTI